MSALYSSLPSQSYTVKEFVRKAKTLEREDGHAFLRFVLTGEADEHQAVLDPIRNTLGRDHDVVATRDYDSVIGITKDIVVKSSISVYPVPNPAEVLTTSIHIKYPMKTGRTVMHIPIHRIPNFEFGYWGQRHMIHIFFPGLLAEGRVGSQLTKDEKTKFYEFGLRPSIFSLLRQDVSDWPATYDAELFRAKKRSGYMSYQTKVLPQWILPFLADTIRAELVLNGVDWGEDLFFTHTIRGTKHGTQHSRNHDAAVEALSEYLEDAKIPQEATEVGEWWIDVGMEFCSSHDACLQWKTSSHFHIVQEVLQIPDNHASRITSVGSSKYARDLVSHLTAVSGCRIEPGAQAEGPFQATYFQMYTTDKAITYNPEGRHHGKAITMDGAMGKTQPPVFIEGLFDVYTSAIHNNSSNARVEVRVPFAQATTVFMRLNTNIVRESLLSFTRSEWWNFRAYRVLGISRTLSLQASGSPALRVRPDALLLTAACVWLINGLHARPDDGPASRNLMQAVLPVTDATDADRNILAYPASTHQEAADEEEEDEDVAPSLPYNPFGLIFLRRVVLDVDVPRMRAGGPFLTIPAFKHLFGASLDEIKCKYYTTGIIPREVVAKKRIVTNKTKRTPTYLNTSCAPQPNVFSLAAAGHKLPPPAIDSGSDIEDREEADETDGGIDSGVSQMWRQFLVDVAVKTPNPRGATAKSYFTVSRDDRLCVGEEFYMNNKLSDMWSACQFKVGRKEDWRLAFDHLFPPLGHQTTQSVQNYTQCKYYIKWKEICATADASSVIAIRKELWKKVSSLFWIPHACQDKMWPTSQKVSGFMRLPPQSAGPAPRILVKASPQWE